MLIHFYNLQATQQARTADSLDEKTYQGSFIAILESLAFVIDRVATEVSKENKKVFLGQNIKFFEIVIKEIEIWIKEIELSKYILIIYAIK